MNLTKRLSLVISVAAVAAACSSNGTDPTLLDGGATKASIHMKTFSSSAAASSTNALTRASQSGSGNSSEISPAGSGVVLASAHAIVNEIDAETPEGLECPDMSFVESDSEQCDVQSEERDGSSENQTEIKITGPFDFDLFTGISTPPLDNVTLPSGIYKEVHLRGSSVSADGTFLDQENVNHKLHLAIDINEEVNMEDSAGMEVAENSVSSILLKLDVDKWFVGIDLANCIASGGLVIDSGTDTLTIDGSIVASGECKDVLEQIKENIRQSFDVEKDDSSSETDPSSVDGADPSTM